MSVNEILGDAGAGYGTGAVTITPPGGKKIFAIGVISTANVTSLKYTPPKIGNTVIPEKQVTNLDWFGKSLPPVGPTTFIPLGYDANEVVIASGTIMVYYR